MDISKNSGTLKSSIFIGFCIINYPFWGTTILGNTHMDEDIEYRYVLLIAYTSAAADPALPP